MIDANYTNRELAKDFQSYKLVQASAIGLEESRKTIRSIENAEIDIPRLYERDGNLSALNVKGIGKKRIPELELILRVGAEEALRLAREEKDRKLETMPWFGGNRREY